LSSPPSPTRPATTKSKKRPEKRPRAPPLSAHSGSPRWRCWPRSQPTPRRAPRLSYCQRRPVSDAQTKDRPCARVCRPANALPPGVAYLRCFAGESSQSALSQSEQYAKEAVFCVSRPRSEESRHALPGIRQAPYVAPDAVENSPSPRAIFGAGRRDKFGQAPSPRPPCPKKSALSGGSHRARPSFHTPWSLFGAGLGACVGG
jgi:hypothetical protein